VSVLLSLDSPVINLAGRFIVKEGTRKEILHMNDPQIAFEFYKKKAITAAAELMYPKAVVKSIKKATSESEINKIMRQARLNYDAVVPVDRKSSGKRLSKCRKEEQYA